VQSCTLCGQVVVYGHVNPVAPVCLTGAERVSYRCFNVRRKTVLGPTSIVGPGNAPLMTSPGLWTPSGAIVCSEIWKVYERVMPVFGGFVYGLVLPGVAEPHGVP